MRKLLSRLFARFHRSIELEDAYEDTDLSRDLTVAELQQHILWQKTHKPEEFAMIAWDLPSRVSFHLWHLGPYGRPLVSTDTLRVPLSSFLDQPHADEG